VLSANLKIYFGPSIPSTFLVSEPLVSANGPELAATLSDGDQNKAKKA
jgi:hypothetical protein